MPNDTLTKFGYPDSLIKTYQYWNLLLRPEQVTLGSLILICKEPIRQYSDISAEALTEKRLIIKDLEGVLKKRFNFSKINYLMLMMVDPALHFHIIPRYEHSVEFCDQHFPDQDWPNAPNLGQHLNITELYYDELLKTLKNDFAIQNDQSSTLTKPSKTKPYHRIYTSGCFDIFHSGHLNILKKTKALCDHLIVGVSTDKLILQSKGRLPIIPFEERIQILETNIYVDEVIPQINKDKQYIVDQYNIDAISVGSDWKGKYPKVSCDMLYFDYTPNVSSTLLKQKLNIAT